MRKLSLAGFLAFLIGVPVFAAPQQHQHEQQAQTAQAGDAKMGEMKMGRHADGRHMRRRSRRRAPRCVDGTGEELIRRSQGERNG